MADDDETLDYARDRLNQINMIFDELVEAATHQTQQLAVKKQRLEKAKNRGDKANARERVLLEVDEYDLHESLTAIQVCRDEVVTVFQANGDAGERGDILDAAGRLVLAAYDIGRLSGLEHRALKAAAKERQTQAGKASGLVRQAAAQKWQGVVQARAIECRAGQPSMKTDDLAEKLRVELASPRLSDSVVGFDTIRKHIVWLEKKGLLAKKVRR